MEKDKKKHLKMSRRVAVKVFAAILEGAVDGDDGLDMDAAFGGTAVALDTLFHQYVELADDTITEVELVECFCYRLKKALKLLAESQWEGGGE